MPRQRVDPAFEARLRAEYAGRKDAYEKLAQCRAKGNIEGVMFWRDIAREYEHTCAVLEGRKPYP